MQRLECFLCFLSILLFSSCLAFSQPVQIPAYKKSAHRLSKPLIGEDGRIYACSENNLFSFETNGSIAWSVHLNHKCNIGIVPVYGGRGKIFLVAENRILKASFGRNGTFLQSASEVFFESGETIIGFAVSTLSSSVFITVKDRGLYAYDMLGQQLWIAEPKFEQFGYRLGCQKDDRDCFFNSAPMIDQCEASIYISNTEGEVYSLSLRGPHVNWIQDFSSIDKYFTITPGNNGLLYLIFPIKSLIETLDAFSGNIQWQKNLGPLSASGCKPVVDSNGWISVGSLDGSLYSFSPTGKLEKFPESAKPESVIQVDPFLDCSGYALYISQTKMDGKTNQIIGEYTYVSAKKPENTVFSLLVPATGSVYLSETYPDEISVLLSEKDMQHFLLDEGIVLAFIAASKTGNPLQCRSKSEKLASSCSLAQPKHANIYIGNERAIMLFLLFESVILIILAGLVRFCCVFWKKNKLQQGQTLGKFLEKRRSLRLRKKEFDRTITELQRNAEGNEVIEEIGDLVRQRENIERKLSSTYSLGRDRDRSKSKSETKSASSLLPLYNGNNRSLFFQSADKESVTIFQTVSDEESSYNDDDEEEEDCNLECRLKGKSLIETEDSSGGDVHVRDYYWGSQSEPASSPRWSVESLSVPSSSRGKCLKRRRTMS